jgi:hypothetical protein
MKTAYSMLAAAVAAASFVVTSRADIYLDCGPTTGVQQAGWTDIDPNDNYWDGTALDLGGGVTAGFGDNYNVSSSLRANAGIMGGLGLDELLRDFIQFNADMTYDRHKLQIKGLPDGDYKVTVYAFDPSYPAESAGNYFNINGTITSKIGPASGHDNDPAYITASVDVTLSSGAASNVIFISRRNGLDGNGADDLGGMRKLNGVVIESVPEPATMGLLALGTLSLAALRRRRK